MRLQQYNAQIEFYEQLGQDMREERRLYSVEKARLMAHEYAISTEEGSLKDKLAKEKAIQKKQVGFDDMAEAYAAEEHQSRVVRDNNAKIRGTRRYGDKHTAAIPNQIQTAELCGQYALANAKYFVTEGKDTADGIKERPTNQIEIDDLEDRYEKIYGVGVIPTALPADKNIVLVGNIS